MSTWVDVVAAGAFIGAVQGNGFNFPSHSLFLCHASYRYFVDNISPAILDNCIPEDRALLVTLAALPSSSWLRTGDAYIPLTVWGCMDVARVTCCVYHLSLIHISEPTR